MKWRLLLHFLAQLKWKAHRKPNKKYQHLQWAKTSRCPRKRKIEGGGGGEGERNTQVAWNQEEMKERMWKAFYSRRRILRSRIISKNNRRSSWNKWKEISSESSGTVKRNDVLSWGPISEQKIKDRSLNYLASLLLSVFFILLITEILALARKCWARS